MANDGWDDVRHAFRTFSGRLDAAPELIATAMKSLTWDFFVHQKTPQQALLDIQRKATELERHIQEHNRRVEEQQRRGR